MEKQKVLYKQQGFPVLQNRVFDTAEEAKNSPTGDILLVEDLETGLIYNAAFDAGIIVYDQNYDNEQSHSQRFQKHLEQVADIITTKMGTENLVEVGCGKGYFLELLLEKGVDVSGFDPTYDGSNQRVQKKFFEPGIIDAANGLILRHVLEHIENPVDFLFNLKEANNGKGLIYIEVPCFDWICQHKAWYDIFYEHVNYFRKNDFLRIFSNVLSIGNFFDGQYIYVVADLEHLQMPLFNKDHQVEFPTDFTQGINKKTNKPVIVWGGASKGTIFSLLKSRTGQEISFAIDINPAKQGKYLAVTGLEVVSPDNAMKISKKGTEVYVMNPNYIEEIHTITNGYFSLQKI